MVLAEVIDMLGWFLLGIPPLVIVLLLAVFYATIGQRKLAALSLFPAILGSIWTFGTIFALGYRVDIVTAETGVPRRTVYARALSLADEGWP